MQDEPPRFTHLPHFLAGMATVFVPFALALWMGWV